MNEVSLFPQMESPPATGVGTWTEAELTRTVLGSSPHVQYLLRELAEGGAVRGSQLKSQRVAYAICQRICSSAGKDSLVQLHEEDGERVYALNPRYRTAIGPMVAHAVQPPPSEPKPRKPRGMGLGRGRRGMSAIDGIATTTPSSMSSGVAQTGLSMRRIHQSSSGRSLALPADVPLQFCQDLMAFLNSTGSSRYRVVLDVAGPRLELA